MKGTGYETGTGSPPGRTGRHRLLYLVGQLGFGGSEGQLRLLLKHLDSEVFEPFVHVYHSSPNTDYLADLREVGIEVTVAERAATGVCGKPLLTVRSARRIRPDVIHSWAVHDNPYAALAARACGARVWWGSLRGSTTLPGFRSLPRFYRRLALRSAQRIVVNSGALADELRGLGLPGKRILVLPNCVDGNVFRAEGADVRAFAEHGFNAGHRVIGNVGNIRRVKNQVLFIRALAKVIETHPEARGMVIGETLTGEEETRAALEGEIGRLGLAEKVVLAGFRDDVPQIMEGFAALCMTSDSEGMPNVVLEAMAAGVPVVATRAGGVADVVRNGETGFLVETGDVDGVAAAMCRILDDPEEATRMAEAGRDLALEERSCDAIAGRLGSAYLEALANAGVV